MMLAWYTSLGAMGFIFRCVSFGSLLLEPISKQFFNYNKPNDFYHFIKNGCMHTFKSLTKKLSTSKHIMSVAADEWLIVWTVKLLCVCGQKANQASPKKPWQHSNIAVNLRADELDNQPPCSECY